MLLICDVYQREQLGWLYLEQHDPKKQPGFSQEALAPGQQLPFSEPSLP
jgi:hypothetical protein